MPDNKQLIGFGIQLVLIIGGVLIANNYIQPMINSGKYTPPATA